MERLRSASSWFSTSYSHSSSSKGYATVPTASTSRRGHASSIGSNDAPCCRSVHHYVRPGFLILFGAAILVCIAIDRKIMNKRNLYNEKFLFTNWLNRPINPSLGSERSDLASLSSVCKAPGVKPNIPLEGKVDVGMDRMMSEGACEAVFPSLYAELDRAVAYYQARGLVELWELDQATDYAHARVLIHNNRVFVKEFKGGPGKRTEAALNAIQEAVITSPEAIPNVEFVIETLDAPRGEGDTSPLWVLDRTEEQESVWLMPDYGFYSWPEPKVGGITEVRDKCADWESKQTWKDKISKVVWRGAILVRLREQLLEISQGFSWSDIAAIDWGKLNGMLKTPEEHCAYKYVLHAEGYAYSGRLKYLQMCRSVVVAHEMSFIQHFHHLIDSQDGSPTQNMVLAPGPGFEGLPQVMQQLIENDERAERIANNSYELFRHYLSPAAVSCYWRQMFRSWAKVQAYTPVRHAQDTSFESFNLMGLVEWSPS